MRDRFGLLLICWYLVNVIELNPRESGCHTSKREDR